MPSLMTATITHYQVPQMEAALEVVVVADRSGPEIAQVSLDLDTGSLNLSFSEPVSLASLTPTAINITSNGVSFAISPVQTRLLWITKLS